MFDKLTRGLSTVKVGLDKRIDLAIKAPLDKGSGEFRLDEELEDLDRTQYTTVGRGLEGSSAGGE